MSRWLAALLFALAPAVALACPACAGRNDGGLSTLYLLGTMILLPFGVAAVVLTVVRRTLRDEARPLPEKDP
jgi:hypothetical protein